MQIYCMILPNFISTQFEMTEPWANLKSLPQHEQEEQDE